MATTPFFGKRDSGVLSERSNVSNGPPGATVAPQPRALDSATAAAPDPTPQTAPGMAASTTPRGGSKLIVGPNIKLKGVEITDCDTLVVEGLVEATMDSRLMQIAEIGAFKGSAQIDIAEIRGCFDGDLTVRDRLVIHATGKVTGKIRYGKVVIEEGGQLAGDISFGTSDRAQAAGALPALQRAA